MLIASRQVKVLSIYQPNVENLDGVFSSQIIKSKGCKTELFFHTFDFQNYVLESGCWGSLCFVIVTNKRIKLYGDKKQLHGNMCAGLCWNN